MHHIRRAIVILLVGCSLALISTWLVVPREDSPTLALSIPPLLFAIAGIASIGYLALKGVPYLLNPVTALAFALAAYFGAGGLSPAWANQPTVEFLQGTFEYTVADIIKSHQIIAVGHIVICLILLLTARGPKELPAM